MAEKKEYFIKIENQQVQVSETVYRTYYGLQRRDKTLKEKDQRNGRMLYSNLDKITGLNAVMPIAAYEELCTIASTAHQSMGDSREWQFSLDSLLFTIEDNYKLDEIKDYLVEQNLAGSSGLRAAIDDRILKGTVAPIESNLALLEGLYSFFFVMITAIGFFISFLLARGRKAEYAVMRLLGESRIQITMKALTEQFTLCLVGVVIGALIERKSFDGAICSVILLCYTMGAAAAVMLNVGVNVMDILRDKE